MQIGQLVVAVVVLLVLDKMQLLLHQVEVKVETVVLVHLYLLVSLFQEMVHQVL
jgi:hypothetical protein